MRSTIADIKSKIDIVSLVSETVNIKRSGRNYSGMCPFHANERTPAFSVFPATRTWYCFGGCGGGDVFSFVMKRDNINFSTALKTLAEKAGVRLPDHYYPAVDNGRVRLHKLLETAAERYYDELQSSETSLYYLHGRGVSASSITYFQIGYARDAWGYMLDYLRGRGYTYDECVGAGLAVRGRTGFYDRFRNRIMFPVRDLRGRVCGFAGRALSNNFTANKYINTPNGDIFNKGKLLYGLTASATRAIRENKFAVLVEGYFDVISAHQHGYQNVISPMGTALTHDQLTILRSVTDNLVLCYDGDEGGRKAMQSIVERQSSLDRALSMDINLSIVILPEGKDPDDMIYDKTWEQVIGGRKPIIDFLIDSLSGAEPSLKPNEMHTRQNQISRLIEQIPSATVREKCYQMLARKLSVSVGAVRADGGRGRKKPADVGVGAGETSPEATMESALIIGILNDVEMLDQADQQLKQAKLPPITALDFQDALCAMIFDLVASSRGDVDLSASVYSQMSLEECDLWRERVDNVKPYPINVDYLAHWILRKRRAKLIDENASIGVIIDSANADQKRDGILRITQNNKLVASIDTILGNR